MMNWIKLELIEFHVFFKHPFEITEFSILEFEQCIENSEASESRLFFSNLIIELLRGLYQNPKIDDSSYEEILREICEVRLKADNAVFNPLSSRDTTFFDLPLKLRIWLLYKLCCWRLDDEQSITDAIDIKVFKHQKLFRYLYF